MVGIGEYTFFLQTALFVIASALLVSITHGIQVERRRVTFPRLVYLIAIIPYLYAIALSPKFHAKRKALLLAIAVVYGSHHLSVLCGYSGLASQDFPQHPLKRIFDC